MSNRLDRISNLPDGVIHHIFSFLPTQNIVQSTVLAKRWRNLWRSAPTLYFDRYGFRLPSETSYYDENVDNLFYKFVDYVLLLRDQSNIQELCIRWTRIHNLFDSSHVYVWILFAIRHDIPILCLELNLPDPEDLMTLEFSEVVPSALFMSESLTKLTLHLDMEYVGYLILPSSTNLSGLKFLDLQDVTFRDQKSADAFFSSCSVLESLVLKNCICLDGETITIDADRLETLSVFSGFKDMNLKVSAPSLEQFKLDVESSYEKLLLDSPSLISACFHYLPNEQQLSPLVLLRTLKSVCNAQIIELSDRSLEVLLEGIDLLHESPISFSKLKFMKLFGTNDTIPLMMTLLGFSPNMESLVLKFDEESFKQKVCNKKDKDVGCFLKLDRLKSIVIHGFDGSEDQQEILQMLWDKAVVLEKITIYFEACKTSLEQKRLTKLSERLFKSQKSFPNVRITFHSTLLVENPLLITD